MTAAPTLDAHTRRWRMVGWGLIVAFFGGGFGWAATTTLDAAAVAAGTVAVESSRKSIQHLEGGIVKAIHVREGERVTAGQTLVTLDETAAGSAVEQLRGQIDAALALHARLTAEWDGTEAITFPPELLNRSDDPKVRRTMDTQVDVLDSRRALMAGQIELLHRKRAGEESKIVGYARQIEANRRELTLLADEISEMETAVREGVVARTKFIALKRSAAAVAAEQAQNEAQLAETRKALAEVVSQLKLPEAENRRETAAAIQEVEERLAGLREKLLTQGDVLSRTEIRAPQAGTIVDIRIHTDGGVIQPGQRLMDLVPDNDRLVIEARVHPNDMASVYRGMPARVRISAFNPRTTPALEGKVVSVSADRIVDAATGEIYFEARIVPDSGAGPAIERMMPGMQAVVFLIKQPRTVLDYALAPLLRAVTTAGRES